MKVGNETVVLGLKFEFGDVGASTSPGIDNRQSESQNIYCLK